MKTAIGFVLVCFVVVTVALAGADTPAGNLPGMTFRLELFVTDMHKSIDFYTNVLGFERLKASPTYAPVRSGSVVIGLGPAAGLPKSHHFNPQIQQDRRGLGVEIVLEVDDVQACFEKVKAGNSQSIRSPLRKQSWGLTDFRIADPDGYYLRITSK